MIENIYLVLLVTLALMGIGGNLFGAMYAHDAIVRHQR